VAVLVLPAASAAVIVMRLSPIDRSIGLVAQDDVPNAAPDPPRLFAHVMLTTPTLSDALPVTMTFESVVRDDPPACAGEKTITVGGVRS
jgi:hypothetical protein